MQAIFPFRTLKNKYNFILYSVSAEAITDMFQILNNYYKLSSVRIEMSWIILVIDALNIDEFVPNFELLPTFLEFLCTHLEFRIKVISLYLPIRWWYIHQLSLSSKDFFRSSLIGFLVGVLDLILPDLLILELVYDPFWFVLEVGCLEGVDLELGDFLVNLVAELSLRQEDLLQTLWIVLKSPIKHSSIVSHRQSSFFISQNGSKDVLDQIKHFYGSFKE